MVATTLNLANYTAVWQDNFTTATSLNANLFPIKWGDSHEFAFSQRGLTLTSDGNAAGFTSKDLGASNSTGYGLYQATFSMPQNQAAGAYICLWPASNVWPGPEVDLVEQMNGKTYLTVHWKGSNGSNQYHSVLFSANVSQPTTVGVDWERSALSFYVNGHEVVSFPAGGSVPVPKDYADGGQNESFGAGDSGPAGTKLTLLSMSYSKFTSAKAASAKLTSAPIANSQASTTALGGTVAQAGAADTIAVTAGATNAAIPSFLAGTTVGADHVSHDAASAGTTAGADNLSMPLADPADRHALAAQALRPTDGGTTLAAADHVASHPALAGSLALSSGTTVAIHGITPAAMPHH
jgi:hypothetical protein